MSLGGTRFRIRCTMQKRPVLTVLLLQVVLPDQGDATAVLQLHCSKKSPLVFSSITQWFSAI